MAETVLLQSLSPARRRIAFTILLLGALLPPLNMFIVTIALPVIRASFGASEATTSLIVSGYAAAFAVSLITGGRLGDLYGRRFIYMVGMASFVASSLVSGLALNPGMLLVGRILQGISAALMTPPVLASLRTLFTLEEVPWALNIYATGIGVAVAGGQFLGGVLIAADLWGLGWRSAFLINVPVGLLALAVAPFFVPESGGRNKPQLDIGGVVLLSAALASFVLPLSIGREQHWARWVLVMLAASPMLGLVFFVFERRLTAGGGMPILDATLLRVPSFRRGLLAALLFFSTVPFYLFFSLYLQAGLGESALAAGLAVLPYGVANFVGPMLATRAPATWRPHLFWVGMVLEIAGYSGVGLCGATQTSGAILFAMLFVGGFGQGIAMPPLFNAILGDVPEAYSGLASGMMNSTLQLGGAISVAAIGSLFFVVLGDGSGAAAYGQAFGVTMGAVALALCFSFLFGLRAKRHRA